MPAQTARLIATLSAIPPLVTSAPLDSTRDRFTMTGAMMKSPTERTSSTSATMRPSTLASSDMPARNNPGLTVLPAPKPSSATAPISRPCRSGVPAPSSIAPPAHSDSMPPSTSTGR